MYLRPWAFSSGSSLDFCPILKLRNLKKKAAPLYRRKRGVVGTIRLLGQGSCIGDELRLARFGDRQKLRR